MKNKDDEICYGLDEYGNKIVFEKFYRMCRKTHRSLAYGI